MSCHGASQVQLATRTRAPTAFSWWPRRGPNSGFFGRVRGICVAELSAGPPRTGTTKQTASAGSRVLASVLPASAASSIKRVNPLVQVNQLRERLNDKNAQELLKGHDIVLDGCDNFDTKYAVDDACRALGIPCAYAAILRFEGQASTFNYPPGVGPSYRDLMPEGPAPGTVPSCAEGGVLGVLPGVLGCIQATEVLKVLLKRPASDCLAGLVLVYDARRSGSPASTVIVLSSGWICGARRVC